MVRRRLQFRLCAAFAVAVLAGSAALRSDETSDPASPQPADADTQEPEPGPVILEGRPQRVIVLITGRVIHGDVVERPGGYLVREQFGSVVIPFTQVRLTAADLPDAYRKVSAALVSPTAGQHLDLARWCYQNRLYDSAQVQIKQALMLEPERRDARDFLLQLQRTLEAEARPEPSATRGEALNEAEVGEFPGQSWKSLARRRKELSAASNATGRPASPELVKEFVQQVQPLLINKCGNARCHGQAASTDFRLAPARQGLSGFRLLTEKNLSAVLQQVDNNDAAGSPLLAALEGTHGGTKPVLTGPAAARQAESLRAWVQLAVRERAGAAITLASASSAAGSPAPGERTDTPKDDPFLQQILDQERPDRFDPAVFNRMMHASTGGGRGGTSP